MNAIQNIFSAIVVIIMTVNLDLGVGAYYRHDERYNRARS